MSLYNPAYRARVYAPRRVDRNENTILTARDSSDEFLVTTLPEFTDGVGTWKPYLEALRGRRGSVDLLGKDTDTGRLDLTIFDVRKTAGGSNAERWFTQFFGDEGGVVHLLGCKVYVEESTDGGSTWTSYFTGRIQTPQLQSRIKCVLTCRDMGEEMESVVLFGGMPHSSIDYAAMANFFPVGLPVTYGGREATPLLQGVIASWTTGKRKIEIKKDYAGFRIEQLTATNCLTNIVNAVFYTRWIGNSNTRVEVEFLDGSHAGLTGSYQLDLGAITVREIPLLGIVGITEINSLDPDYLPIASASVGDRVEFKIYPFQNTATDAAETAKTEEKEKERKPPMIIGDVNPATLAADICEGNFSFLYTPGPPLPSGAAYGEPTQKIPYNSASFAALWNTFNTEGISMRWIIEEPMKAKDWFVDEFGIPLNVAHYFNADGELTLIDMTRPATASITGTITNADLILNSTPRQTIDKSKAITNWKWNVKSEWQWTREMLSQKFGNDDSADPLDISPALVETSDQWDRAFYPRFLDIGDKTQKIEANGLRAWVETDDDIENLNEVKNIVYRRVIEELGPIYACGPTTYELDCVRTSNTNDCVEGSYRLLEINELIDPVTNQRGGVRAALCYERYNDGPKINLKFLDLGPGTTAFPPGGVGNIVTSSNDSYHDVWFQSVYPNKAGDRVSFYTAATSQSVGTRPASDSSLWKLQRTEMLYVTSSYSVRDLPSGTRIWGRIRTELAVSGNVAPSTWLYPDNDYADMSTYPLPGIITTSDITGGTTEITWTNPAGSSDAKVEILLDEAVVGSAVLERIAVLPPKSDTYTIYGMITSSIYTAGVRYIDANGQGGYGAIRTKQFTTSGSYATCPRPVDIIAI